MKKLTGVLILAVFAAEVTGSGDGVAVAPRRRRADGQEDSGVFAVLGGGINVIKSVPVVGGLFDFLFNWALETFNVIENATNGLIARLLGGALPCQFSMKNGVQCTGITDDNSLGTHLTKVIQQTPLPGFVVSFLELLLKIILDPATNVIFGGMPTTGR